MPSIINKSIVYLLRTGWKQIPGFIAGALLAYSAHGSLTRLHDAAYFNNYTYHEKTRQGRVESRPEPDKETSQLVQQLYDTESGTPVQGWVLSKYIIPMDNRLTFELARKKMLEDSLEERVKARGYAMGVYRALDASVPKPKAKEALKEEVAVPVPEKDEPESQTSLLFWSAIAVCSVSGIAFGRLSKKNNIQVSYQRY